MRASTAGFRIVVNAIVFLIAIWHAAPVAADPTWRWSGVERVVAFGDVHGAYRELVGLLQRAQVIDADLRWSGGAAHLVSLGDLVDRGPDSRAVMDLLMRLETEASRAGGDVHLVLGNHEAMNLTGDYRYVSDTEYASFAEPASSSQVRPGEAELRAAFSASGRYGAWLLAHPALIVINDTAFVHGGLPASIAELGLADANARVHEELVNAMTPENTTLGPLLSDTGPLWYRGTARCHALIEERRLQRSLDRLSVRRVVIGHTPARSLRASSRFGGDVVMLDTGMLAQVYHGRPSALVVENGKDRILVSGGAEEAIIADPSGYSGTFDTSDGMAATFATAPVSTSKPSNDGRDVELATANGPVLARFIPLPKDRLRHEIAAYRLDRLLGLGIVAPAVGRDVDGERGLLTVANDTWYSERQRLDKGTARPNDCEVGSDYLLMSAFDALIGNDARTVDNLGYDQSSGELRLRDHGGAFGRSGLRQNPNEPSPKLPRALREVLLALDERALNDALGDQLQPREIEAMLGRRDTIVGSWKILE